MGEFCLGQISMLSTTDLACVAVLYIFGGGESSLTRTLFFTDILTAGGSHFHLGCILSFVTELEIHSYMAKLFLLFL